MTKKIPKLEGPQRVFVNVPVPAAVVFDERGRPSQHFPTNAVYTYKYSVLSFLPKNLFEQFRRIANLYFLGLTVLQFFPKYQTINPFVSALPLIVIVGLTAVKDGFEDWRRHQSDAEMNATLAWCIRGDAWKNSNEPFFKRVATTQPWESWGLKRRGRRKSGGKISPSGPSLENLEAPPPETPKVTATATTGTTIAWTATPWADVVTGDLVLLKDNSPVPADLVILATSEPDGLCYVETKNLDGETNLKIRQGVPATAAVLAPEHLNLIRDFKCVVECERPNNSLYTFTGTLVLPPAGEAGKDAPIQVPLSVQNVLLRGCYLRNTAWAIGLAVQTGASTKIRQNAGKTPMKRSRTEKNMNIQVFINLGVLLAVCIVTCIANPLWERNWSETNPIWLDWTFTGVASFASAAMDAFWNSIIIYQNVVPLSLYITLEIVKTMQAYFIYEDLEMFYAPNHRCIPRSWGIADDLGQIEYVFSDKTGTLTRNNMEFKKFSIAGVIYGAGIVDDDNNVNDDGTSKKVADATKPPFWDDLLETHMAVRDTTQYECLREFFLALAVCHSVLVTPATEENPGPPVYKASSPDEAALVQAARAAGFEFLSRENTAINVKIPDGSILRYELLNVLEFNSTRKRMSVVVRTPENWVAVISKGADSVIWERLAEDQETLREVTGTHLEYFAEEGLRTLCIARAYITEAEYTAWAARYQAASVSLTNREALMDAAAEEIERDLVLIGATAIEDKLQEGVPECIATLMSAGVKVWVLTGDKMETAINIGFSCNLLTRDMRLILIRGDENDKIEENGPVAQLSKALETFFPTDTSAAAPSTCPYGLIIDGAALAVTLQSPYARAHLLRLSMLCASVVCCRVSPLQKAQIVNLVKDSQHSMTLAIGDGANDVSMIQAAHIGVGIAGEEGLQAAMAADYAIAQFRFLSRLLLVHGRWSFRRTSDMILCFFFKNIIWVMVLFWFQFWCGFSSLSLYDPTYTLLYNVVFTALPVITLGIFDQDLSEKYVVMVPPVYSSGIRWVFSFWRFGFYMLDAMVQSVVILLVVLATFRDSAGWPGSYSSAGRVPDLALIGSTSAIIAVINANAVLVVSTNSFTWLSWLAYGFSEAIVILWTIVYSFFPGTTLGGVVIELASSPGFWLSFILATTICQLPRLVVKYTWRLFRPSDTEIVQEIQKFGLDEVLKGDDRDQYHAPHHEPPAAQQPLVSGGAICATPEPQTRPQSREDEEGRLEMGSGNITAQNIRDEESSRAQSATSTAAPTSMRQTAIIDAIPMLEPDLSKAHPVLSGGPPRSRIGSSSSSTAPVRRGGHARSASGSSPHGGVPSPLPAMTLTTRLSIRSIPTPSDLATPTTPYSGNYSTLSLSRRRTTANLHFASRVDIRQSTADLAGSQFSVMRTGETTKNRGFCFGQDKGAADVLASHHSSLDVSSPHTPSSVPGAAGASAASRPGSAMADIARMVREYGPLLSPISPTSATNLPYITGEEAGSGDGSSNPPVIQRSTSRSAPPRISKPPAPRRQP
ncbi:phospholipid-translocating P-type ATPase [Powellomyces hirtus]|nr:phospholipid-translocating P-type ATPase [Powellomyces hirtus]